MEPKEHIGEQIEDRQEGCRPVSHDPWTVTKESFDQFIALGTAILAASQSGAMALAEGCTHRLMLAINDDLAVCAVCRSQIQGKTGFGVCLSEDGYASHMIVVK